MARRAQFVVVPDLRDSDMLSCFAKADAAAIVLGALAVLYADARRRHEVIAAV
jgi:hypothetical protein